MTKRSSHFTSEKSLPRHLEVVPPLFANQPPASEKKTSQKLLECLCRKKTHEKRSWVPSWKKIFENYLSKHVPLRIIQGHKQKHQIGELSPLENCRTFLAFFKQQILMAESLVVKFHHLLHTR